MNVTVLGGGRVGNAIALDLVKEGDFSVKVVDINEKNLEKLKEKRIKTECVDLSVEDNIKEVIKDSDFVVGALPGFMGFKTLKAIISQKKNVVDISFFEEDPFLLDELAKKHDVCAVVDAGIAPGVSNLIAGRMASSLDSIESFRVYVGGLPVERKWPYEYKAPFSPIDVIEEYIRPARIIRDGKIVELEPLSDSEYVYFPSIGTLEAFNTDGLRTLIKTIKAKNMVEKTMRYIGHIEKIKILKESGFFSKEAIEVDGKSVVPLSLTAKLLFPLWSFSEDEEDITLMRIEVEGKKENRKIKHTFELFDRMDKEEKISSMARTTGYTATAVLRLLARGGFNKKGIVPLEFIGMDFENYLFIMTELAKRGVVFNEKTY